MIKEKKGVCMLGESPCIQIYYTITM